jgi:hypothetical protein
MSGSSSSVHIQVDGVGGENGTRELANLLASNKIRCGRREDTTLQFRIYSHATILGVAAHSTGVNEKEPQTIFGLRYFSAAVLRSYFLLAAVALEQIHRIYGYCVATNGVV